MNTTTVQFKQLLFFPFFFCLPSMILLGQIQLGQDLVGDQEGDNFGWSVSISADGTIVASGAPRYTGNEVRTGYVKVFKRTGGSWSQLGGTIEGDESDGQFGQSVSLSDDGSTLAVGVPFNLSDDSPPGSVKVYRWENSNWVQMGQDVPGAELSDGFGNSVALSANGNRLAVGAPESSGNGPFSGQVRIFEWNGSQWSQIGSAINGEAFIDNSGESVDISDSGNRVIIGAPFNEGTGFHAGHARVYEFDGNNWSQVGSDLDAEAASNLYGHSVTIASDGNTIAIGAPLNDGSFPSAGQVRVFEWDGNSWVQIGQDIDGENGGDNSGWSVSLSSGGNRIIIGALRNDGQDIDSGHARIYERMGNGWTQLGEDIDGEAIEDQLGRSVSISADGNYIAVGADRAQNKPGLVKVFGFNPLSTHAFDRTELIEMSPNPFKDLITFKQIQKGTFQVYDVFGRQITEKHFNTPQINLSHLPNGVYFIRLEGENASFVGKAIKQE